MIATDTITLSSAARELRVPPALLSSLKYRGLLADDACRRDGNLTLIRRDYLPVLARIVQQHSRYRPLSISAPMQDFA